MRTDMSVYIHACSFYLPDHIIDNAHFERTSGLSAEWIVERTGILTRRKARPDEFTNDLGLAAYNNLLPKLDFPISEIDLIVCATYTPFDTVFTLAHALQRHTGLSGIPVLTVDTACSSLLNAFEIAQGYFAMGKAGKALIVAAEHNTAYCNETDPVAGHLWGDGAAAFLLTNEKIRGNESQIIDLITAGAAVSGKASESVLLRPASGGLFMPNGRDVFLHACQFMTDISRKILDKNQISLDELNWFIPHQANMRIIRNVAEQLGLSSGKILTNVQNYGNTGCASYGIAFAENVHRFSQDDWVLMSVFGGGYSYGACLIRI